MEMESKKIVVEPPMFSSSSSEEISSWKRKRERTTGDLPHHQPETEENNNNNNNNNNTSSKSPLINSNHKKLIYAFGSDALSGLKFLPSKALVCDFATTSASPVWEELPPPFPSPIKFFAGVASPLDGNVYAFGRLLNNNPIGRYPDTYRGLVFDPSSRSWNPCPPPTDLDYGYKSVAVVHTEHDNPSTSRLAVFNYPRVPKAFDLATTQWENAFSAHTPIPVRKYDDEECDPTPTSVGVGNLIYRFTRRKLCALDTSSPKPSFKRVCGLHNKLKTLLDDSNEKWPEKDSNPPNLAYMFHDLRMVVEEDQVKVKQKELKQTTSANGD
ncbi:hypothetical protein LguiA_021843 [Lonicera macranthoides]